jgi:Set1/Ash2 histone methyltransferase complex subunit ASH2
MGMSFGFLNVIGYLYMMDLMNSMDSKDSLPLVSQQVAVGLALPAVGEKRIKKPSVKLEQGISSATINIHGQPITKKPRPSGSAKPKTAKPPFAKSATNLSNSAGVNLLLSVAQIQPKKKEEEKWVPPSVAISARDRAPQLVLSKDQMELTGVTGGYRLARATHGVHNGAYYWEAEILDLLPGSFPNSHVRLGWTTRQGDLQASVGNDAHGYGYRDTSGSKCHKGIRDDSYGAAYGPGDIVGCFLNLDVEDIDNNQMRFFLNGTDQGIAYRGKEIPLGVYFPACSLYMNARVRVNYGKYSSSNSSIR